MSIKQLRKSLGLTQKQASRIVKVPLRTYINYENDESKKDTIKYTYIKNALEKYGLIDENHGLLTINKISEIAAPIFTKHQIKYCYLFGSYAKGTAKETSDVDLLVSTTVTGLSFYGLVEQLREDLHKKVEVITITSLVDNSKLLDEILNDGIKIFG